MRKKLLLFGVLLSSVSMAQLIPVNKTITKGDRRVQAASNRAICGTDTVQYAMAKATGLQALTLNNATSAQALGQYFDAPQAITISGFDFYAWKSDLTNGIFLTVTASIYNVGTDSLPTGAALATTAVVIDTTFGTGSLPELKKTAIFATPVTTSQPYVLVIENNTSTSMALVGNSYQNADGAQEWLASVNIGGSWLNPYGVNVGGTVYDADELYEPHVSYDLTAGFSSDAGCLTGSETVNFTDNSSPVLGNRMYNQAAFLGLTDLSYTYDFGDGSPTENLSNPTHTYAAGAYTVTLTDTLFGWSINCVDQTTISIGGATQTAGYTFTSSNLSAAFTDASIADSTILSWMWDFGDGNTSTVQNPSHTYAADGSYTVCLTITTTCGSSSSCQTVTVSGGVCPDPVSAWSSSASNLVVSFTDASTSANTISSWLWDLGDGNTSTMQNPTHTYTADGTYTVCLIVTDSCGSDTSCMPVTVADTTVSLIESKLAAVKVYPNPATEILTVLNPGISNLSINILDATGKLVYTQNMQPSSNKINVSTLANGVYFVKMSAVAYERTVKFVKQ